jgi:hypothetical protein
MNFFPHGFMLELYALVTPDGHVPAEGVFVDTQPGEYLLPPSLVEIVTGGEVRDPQCFMGVETLAGSTEAEARLVHGPTYLAAVMEVAHQYAADTDDEAAVLDMVLKLSEMLRRMTDQGIRLVRRNADTMGELHPILPVV